MKNIKNSQNQISIISYWIGILLFSVHCLQAQEKTTYATVLKFMNYKTTDQYRMTPSCIDAAGNVIIAGISGTSNKNIYVQKLTSKGSIIWSYEYDSDEQGDDWVSDIQIDNGNNVYLCGSTVNKNLLQQKALLIKLSPAGSLLWKYEYTTTSICMTYPNVHFTKMVINKSDSRVFLAMNYTSSIYIDHILEPNLQNLQDSIQTNGGIQVVKADGNMQITSCGMSMNSDNCYLNQLSLSGSYVISAGTMKNLQGKKYLRIEANSLSSQVLQRVWMKDFYANEVCVAYGMETKGNFIYLVGSADYEQPNNQDFMVMKVNRNHGALSWIYTLNGSKNTPNDAAKDIIIQDNHLYVCGEVNQNTALVQLNLNGIEKMKTGYYANENDTNIVSRVSGMVFHEGYFWVSGFGYKKNASVIQYVNQFKTEGNSVKNYIYSLGMISQDDFFPIIQSKNIAVDSAGSIWLLGIQHQGNYIFEFPVYRISDFYKDIQSHTSFISAVSDTLAMSMALLSQDVDFQSILISYMLSTGKEEINLFEIENIYPDLSLKMTESLALFNIPNHQISLFMNHYKEFYVDGYNFYPYFSIPQLDTLTFDYIGWDLLTLRGIAKFAGKKDSVPLYTLDKNNHPIMVTIPLKSGQDFDRFWAKPCLQMGIQFVDLYNNAKIIENELWHPEIGFRPKAKCYCTLARNVVGDNVHVGGFCFVGGSGCGRETTNAGSNNCSGLDNCIQMHGSWVYKIL